MADPVKSHKEYDELIELLLSRGMDVPDPSHAIKKIAQVGYYRLSGFWYPCRIPHITPENIRTRSDRLRPGTNFRAVYDLYLFDKKLRLLMMNALKRIEVYVRSVIAHELGKISPLGYLDDAMINPKHLKPRPHGRCSARQEWLNRHTQEITKSREDFIKWHAGKYEGLPFWVAIEVWDFGLMSKYYAMLKDSYRNRILRRLGIDAGNGAILENWLSAMNVLRNRCAHHSRIWNKTNEPKIKPLPGHAYFEHLDMNDDACERMYSMIAVLWFLIREIGPGSKWISNVAALIDTKPQLPGCHLTAMGFPDNEGFPRALFNIN